MVNIATSLLDVKTEDALKVFYNLEIAKTDYFHIDVMDSKFVEPNTMQRMQEFANILKQITSLPIEVHLMVEDIKANIDAYLPFEPNRIIFHLEACKDKAEIIKHIDYLKENNCKVGIAIKPNTPIEEIYEWIPYIHMVLVMTVEPGYGGQKLIPETIEKVKKLKEYIQKNNMDIDIEVDGGVTLENRAELIKAGVTILVAGSAILKTKDYKKAISQLKQ